MIKKMLCNIMLHYYKWAYVMHKGNLVNGRRCKWCGKEQYFKIYWSNFKYLDTDEKNN